MGAGMTTTQAPLATFTVTGESAPRSAIDWTASLKAYLVESMTLTETFPEARAVQGRVWLAGGGLSAPVRVRIEAEDGSFYAEEPTTGVFGAGATVAAALDDLRAALREHLDVLQAEEHLSEELQRQLRFLRQHVRSTTA